jgi:hypothetical protein
MNLTIKIILCVILVYILFCIWVRYFSGWIKKDDNLIEVMNNSISDLKKKFK